MSASHALMEVGRDRGLTTGAAEQLAQLEGSLLEAGRDVRELAAELAPRCIRRLAGPGASASEGAASVAALSHEQEARVATSLHDLAAALVACARQAAQLTMADGVVGPGVDLESSHGG